ncbi:CocE/NonD family hydrolase [Luteimonas sp. RIT-PG2_3]
MSVTHATSLRATRKWAPPHLLALCLFALSVMAMHLLPGSAQAVVRQAAPDDDFVLIEEMVPMRDGERLRTFIVAPKQITRSLPILLQRTPYRAASKLKTLHQPKLQSLLGTSLAELEGYIFVFQDIRGRHGSSGDFVLQRPVRGAFNTSATDETTDAWDTIDWLVKHVDHNNGRVGIYGTSYDGWTSLMALIDPHPALKVAVPVNPAVDFWMGDDWFHNGAFRPAYAFEYVHALETDLSAWSPFPFDRYDTYDWWLRAGSPTAIGRRYFDPARHKYWTTLTQHPTYDSYWQNSALDKALVASKGRQVPTMHVHGWFDQEDLYGAPAAYAALEPRDRRNDSNFLVAGPWAHGQNWASGDRLGNMAWNEDTALRWRQDMLAPFLAHYLKDAPAHRLAPVTVFNTGSRRWERLEHWPRAEDTRPRALFLQPDLATGWTAPVAADGSTQDFVSDPAKPVPYQPRPIRRIYDDDLGYAAWRSWLVGDQRFVDGRPDVLTFVGEPLTDAVTVRGTVTATLFAETDGSDADWVVKLIDVFPDQDPQEPTMSGYQLMISGDILRGRYREGFEQARPVAAGQALEYAFRLPQVNHTFRQGHRIMVQVQSSWFPLYDRNPQAFIPSIMDVEPGQYRKATHRIHTSRTHPSRIELQVAH